MQRCKRCFLQPTACGHCVGRAKRQAARLERLAAEREAQRREALAYLIGTLHPNLGPDLEVGKRWETTDGFLVEQATVTGSAGTVRVLGFAGETR